MPTGVGIIGAGPGAAALHAPTLARRGGRFAVVHVADGGSGRAASLADRSGARSSSGAEELLADPAVEAVVIASPPEQHAAQVLAAVAAGKRAILCEKPLAITHDDVDAVVAACRDAGTALIVGTNHLHDPAWAHVKHHIVARGAPVRDISIAVSLPPNDRYHAVVTESPAVAAPTRGAPPDTRDPAVAAALVHRLVLGLCVHDVPLLRDLAPDLERVVFARPVPPVGCSIGFVASGAAVQVTAAMAPAGAEALWRMTVGVGDDRIDIVFPPAFVHDGSAVVEVRHADGRVVRHAREPEDGYAALWRAFEAQIDGVVPVEYDEIAADAHGAVALAEAAAEAVRSDAADPARAGDAADARERARDSAGVQGNATADAAEPFTLDLSAAGDAAERFRVAAAELPLTISGIGSSPRCSGHAAPGDAGVAAPADAERILAVADGAVVAGARTILSEPSCVDASTLAGAAATVERTRLQPLPGSAARVAGRARAVVVEAALPVSEPAAWLRDAIGWCRVLAGPLVLGRSGRAGEPAGGSIVAELRSRQGVPVSLVAGTTAGPPRIVARTLGAERLEVVVDEEGAAIRLATEEGELLLPPDRESSARLALRRAARGADDLPDLLHDERLRARLTERP